ncbi:hypothetical protein CRE_15711 [Caenorhabditis remanei]|uniref:DUF7154 domain-containing protein n=1 Tax=Caenorhabditis remanei TaxID=31234 RepID=E3NCA1_CAERE|nr:hypothetical protein CRE_15711 [Caenorhabditis remanei]
MRAQTFLLIFCLASSIVYPVFGKRCRCTTTPKPYTNTQTFLLIIGISISYPEFGRRCRCVTTPKPTSKPTSVTPIPTPKPTPISTPDTLKPTPIPSIYTPPPACRPRQNTTVLFAYSTDIDYKTYSNGAAAVVGYGGLYAKTANVRFDTTQDEEIEYHTDRRNLNASLLAHPPNPSLGYGNKTTGSNLYKVLKKFLNNKKAPICGAIVYIAVKRYPDESDVSDIISQLRANHVIVHIFVDSIPSGGSNSATLYKMSLQTNGYCVFATGYDLSTAFGDRIWALKYPYQFLAQNFLVSGSGRIEIRAFKTPIPPGYSDWCEVAITVQNHSKHHFQVKLDHSTKFAALDDSFVSMNYTIESTDGSDVYEFPRIARYLYGTAQTAGLRFNGSLSYKWTIDYHYDTDAPQIIQLRMYSRYYHDFLPLPDFK